ncbi:MAG: glycosyltransferase family 4 protein [Desulfobacteraceae bacterium]|nr:glycosyltransferase family 4 protein [Desulfobacteraceae bacterium]
MKIAFIDFMDWNYSIDTPYRLPMGGMQSSLCYLAEEMVKQGHEVFLFNGIDQATTSRGVKCIPVDSKFASKIKSLEADYIIVLSDIRFASVYKPILSKKTRFICWTGHAHDQPGVMKWSNPDLHHAWDGFSLVSKWQQDKFHYKFKIDLRKTKVLHNAAGPYFKNMYGDKVAITAQKNKPVLAYTSTPFRGLDLLAEAFPLIRAEIPEASLKIFSSMKVYQIPESEDEFSDLYKNLQNIDGVEYIGSVSQKTLANELKNVSVLAYPNTFAETSCISVMEAMASGCTVVTSDYGALPETLAGFGYLASLNKDSFPYGYILEFVKLTIKALNNVISGEAEKTLQSQVAFANKNYTWRTRARQWIEWMQTL